MASEEFRGPRRAFQYWSIVGLSIIIPAAALLGESSNVNVPMNATLLSLALLGSTVFELAGLHRWQDVSGLIGGIWLATSPWVFGYADAGQLRFWHVGSGALLVLLAMFNLPKDSTPRQSDRAR